MLPITFSVISLEESRIITIFATMNKRVLFLFVSLLWYTMSTMAVPAHPGTIKIQQPDGNYLTLRLVGDEWCHFQTTLDGYSVVKSNRGFYVYAEKKNGQLLPTSQMAHDVESRSADEQAFLAGVKKYLAPEMSASVADMKARAESSGAQRRAQGRRATNYSNFRGLIVLVQFNDRKFSRSDYKEIITDMVNKENYTGFDDYKSTGSVRDYFSDNSCGKFQPQFDVVGPYTVDFSQYDCNPKNGKCSEVLMAAIDSADVDVNYKDYDGDRDGMVDLVFFVVAGNGSNYDGNDENLWWPHRSGIYDPKTRYWIRRDGVILYEYASSVELAGHTVKPSTIHIDGIGTICHEFSHVLGLPDFYDTDYEKNGQSITPGVWSLMDAGSYLNDGFTPVGYSLFERYLVGFVDDIEEIEEEGTYTLDPVHVNHAGFLIRSPEQEEFFLFENRQNGQFKWDAYLPGHGLLVHRVDLSNSNVWEYNTLNANPERNYYELVRAGGTGKANTGYDVFPGLGKVNTLHNSTMPANLKTWSGKATKWGLFNIREENGVVSFDIQDALTLTALTLPDSVEVGRGVTMKLEPLLTPDYAETTLKWSSSNEDIAIVDDEGVVVGIEEGTCVITVESDNGIEAKCQVTVVELPDLSIAEFKQLKVGSQAMLQFNQARAVFVSGSTAYLSDASGAIILDGLDIGLETNDIVDGVIYVKYAQNNKMPYALITDATDISPLTIEKGSEVEPREMKLEDLAEADYADYVLLKQTKLVLESGKVWAVSGDRRIRYYNKLGVKVSLKNYNGKYFDLPVIYGTDMLNGELIDELYIFKQPTEVDDPTGIVELRGDDADTHQPVFNLQGQRVNPATKGLLIRGRRKLFIR